MKVLAVTNMYPSARTPRAGTFIEQQVEGLRRIGLHVEVLLIDRAGDGVSRYLGSIGTIRRAASSGQWDVAHIMSGGVFAYLAIRALSDVPVVVSFCGTDLLGTEDRSPVMRLRGIAGVWASKRVAAKADAIVVKGSRMLTGLDQRLVAGRASVVPNGVDCDRFRPMDKQVCRRRLGWRDGRLHVLFSTHSATDANKRLSLASKAVEAVRVMGVDAELHVMLDVPHQEVPFWIGAADATILTSLHEGSPNIVKETLACNRPVVSVDVGDVAEVLVGIEGCHVAKADPASLAEALLEVRESASLVDSRERMLSLSLEAVAGRILAVYEAAIANPRRSCAREGA